MGVTSIIIHLIHYFKQQSVVLDILLILCWNYTFLYLLLNNVLFLKTSLRQQLMLENLLEDSFFLFWACIPPDFFFLSCTGFIIRFLQKNPIGKIVVYIAKVAVVWYHQSQAPLVNVRKEPPWKRICKPPLFPANTCLRNTLNSIITMIATWPA